MEPIDETIQTIFRAIAADPKQTLAAISLLAQLAFIPANDNKADHDLILDELLCLTLDRLSVYRADQDLAD